MLRIEDSFGGSNSGNGILIVAHPETDTGGAGEVVDFDKLPLLHGPPLSIALENGQEHKFWGPPPKKKRKLKKGTRKAGKQS